MDHYRLAIEAQTTTSTLDPGLLLSLPSVRDRGEVEQFEPTVSADGTHLVYVEKFNNTYQLIMTAVKPFNNDLLLIDDNPLLKDSFTYHHPAFIQYPGVNATTGVSNGTVTAVSLTQPFLADSLEVKGGLPDNWKLLSNSNNSARAFVIGNGDLTPNSDLKPTETIMLVTVAELAKPVETIRTFAQSSGLNIVNLSNVTLDGVAMGLGEITDSGGAGPNGAIASMYFSPEFNLVTWIRSGSAQQWQHDRAAALSVFRSIQAATNKEIAANRPAPTIPFSSIALSNPVEAINYSVSLPEGFSDMLGLSAITDLAAGQRYYIGPNPDAPNQKIVLVISPSSQPTLGSAVAAVYVKTNYVLGAVSQSYTPINLNGRAAAQVEGLTLTAESLFQVAVKTDNGDVIVVTAVVSALTGVTDSIRALAYAVASSIESKRTISFERPNGSTSGAGSDNGTPSPASTSATPEIEGNLAPGNPVNVTLTPGKDQYVALQGKKGQLVEIKITGPNNFVGLYDPQGRFITVSEIRGDGDYFTYQFRLDGTHQIKINNLAAISGIDTFTMRVIVPSAKRTKNQKIEPGKIYSGFLDPSDEPDTYFIVTTPGQRLYMTYTGTVKLAFRTSDDSLLALYQTADAGAPQPLDFPDGGRFNISIQAKEVANDYTLTFTTTAPTPPPSFTPLFTVTPSVTLSPSETETPSVSPTPSLSPTASETFTPSATYTPSDTPTVTPTPSDTDTPTITPTPTITLTPSLTFTPSITPTSTPTPVPPALKLANTVQVIKADGLAIHTSANKTSPVIDTLSAGSTLRLVSGPQKIGKDIWWGVFTTDGKFGWVQEQSDKTVFLIYTDQVTTCDGIAPSRLVIGKQGDILPGDANYMNSLPSPPSQDPNSHHIRLISPGGVFTVEAGPVCNANIAWWQVNYHGVVGWTGEAEGDTYWAEPTG